MTTSANVPALFDSATNSEWLVLLHQGLDSLRRSHELTQQQLAEASGLNRETIGRIERGLVRTKLQQATVAALAAAFKCSTLFEFREALQRSRNLGVIRNTTALQIDARSHRLLLAFQELSPAQKDTAEAVVMRLLANVRAHRVGEEKLCTM